MATSNAPVGGTYRNVEHAGQCILEVNAHSFPDTNKSTMIPPKFVTKYPEPIDESSGEILKTKRTLTKKEENRFTGMSRNACGEEAEYKVFKLFERLVQVENDPPLLVMRSFVLQNFRADVLALELGMNFDGIHTVAEFDAVVLVKDTGLILVEVKRQFTEEQQSKAEEQLENGKMFFQRIVSRFAGSACQVPVVKLIMFPDEEAASPTLKSDRDAHIVHKDLMMNFNSKWEDLTSELDALKHGTSFSDNDFQRFAWILAGLWSMEKYLKRFYKFNSTEASSTYQLHQNDDMINRGIFTSDVRTAKDESNIVKPITDVEQRRPQDGFPECSGIDLIYLTPEQKDLYQNFPHTIVRGSAGSGKTLLFHLKIVDILQNHSNKNVLIIAPDPHHLRMEQFIKSNGGQTTVTETFPPPVSGGVVIITLKKFFEVSPETLQSYDVSMYHVFIDDLQNLWLFSSSSLSLSTYDDVVHFIERCYTNLIGGNQLFWCAVDVGQSECLLGKVMNNGVPYLFNIDESTPRNLTIPIYTLNKTLRNSVEISTVVQKVREMRVTVSNASSRVLTSNTTGHRIRSEAVTYHKLTKWTGAGDKDADWVLEVFALERVKEELNSLLNPHTHGMKLSDIAILINLNTLFELQLNELLLSTFNITPQTIEQFIMTNNNTIIHDQTNNVASFECPFVLYLCGVNTPEFYHNYNIMTRARTKLVVVEIDSKQRPPLLTDDVILIQWEEKDLTFYRL